eukprot:scpid73070/ scgid12974/ 
MFMYDVALALTVSTPSLCISAHSVHITSTCMQSLIFIISSYQHEPSGSGCDCVSATLQLYVTSVYVHTHTTRLSVSRDLTSAKVAACFPWDSVRHLVSQSPDVKFFGIILSDSRSVWTLPAVSFQNPQNCN